MAECVRPLKRSYVNVGEIPAESSFFGSVRFDGLGTIHYFMHCFYVYTDFCGETIFIDSDY